MAEGGQRIAFHRSLAGRLLLWAVLPMFAVNAAIIALGGVSRFAALREAAERSLEDGASLAAARIEDANNNAANLARTLADAQTAGLFGRRQQSLALLAIVLEQTPWARACFYAYEPDADGQDRAAATMGVPAAALAGEGRFVPRWLRDPTRAGAIRLEAMENIDASPGYLRARREHARSGGAARVVVDARDEGGERLVDFLAPISLDGVFLGVAGVERALGDFEALLEDASADGRTMAFLLSPDGRVIAVAGAESATLRGMEIRASPRSAIFRRMLDADAGATTLERVVDPVTEESTYFVSAPIAEGGWRLALARPTAVITDPIRDEIARLGLLGLGGLGVVLTVLVVLALRYSRGIAEGVRLASRVAEGDLTAETRVQGPAGGEAALLASSLCRMTRQLDGLVSEVKRAAIRLHVTATQVAATQAEQEQAAQEFSRSSSEIAAAVREITRTSEALAATSRSARAEADESSHLAADSRTALVQMESSMRELDMASGSVAARLAAINEKATAITAIVDTITRVADQTNLLSVNAAIEAEKAGESGRGFLVVAREVRRLADQSAAATVEIEQMVRDMQSAVASGVMEIDRFSDHVRRSIAEVDRIGSQMARVIEQATGSAARFSELDEGVGQQSEGARRIDEAMVRLTAVARRTEESINEFASATEGLREAIASLGNVVNSFKLRSGSADGRSDGAARPDSAGAA